MAGQAPLFIYDLSRDVKVGGYWDLNDQFHWTVNTDGRIVFDYQIGRECPCRAVNTLESFHYPKEMQC